MDLTGLVVVLLVLALIGFLAWIVLTYIPMPDLFQTVIKVVLAVLVVLYLLGLVTGRASFPAIR